MSALALAWRNLVRQKRRSFLMIAVVGFGFAAFALAGGFIAQTFEALKEGTIRSVGHLQIVDRRAVGKAEETTLEFGIPDARRARSIAANDPAVQAVLPRIDFVGLATNGTRSVPFLGVGVDPGPEAAATLASELVVSGQYLSGDGDDSVVLGTGLAAALEVKPGDRVTLMATTPDGSLNAVDAIVSGLVDVQIKELNDRYLAGGIGAGLEAVADLRDGLEARRLSRADGAGGRSGRTARKDVRRRGVPGRDPPLEGARGVLRSGPAPLHRNLRLRRRRAGRDRDPLGGDRHDDGGHRADARDRDAARARDAAVRHPAHVSLRRAS